MRPKTFQLVLLLIICFSDLKSQETNINPYLGISADYIFLTGSYDGKSFFQTDSEIILVPELKPSPGFGAFFGIKMSRMAIDFAYHFTKMDYTSMEEGFSGKSTTHLIRYLGLKRYFKTSDEKKLKPYIDFDLSVSFSHLEKISYPTVDISDMRSANYGGAIFGAGLGTQIMLRNKIALNLEVLPELYIGTDIKSEGSERYEIKKFNNFLLLNSVGLSYYFNEN
jgi:hypothetical protein